MPLKKLPTSELDEDDDEEAAVVLTPLQKLVSKDSKLFIKSTCSTEQIADWTALIISPIGPKSVSNKKLNHSEALLARISIILVTVKTFSVSRQPTQLLQHLQGLPILVLHVLLARQDQVGLLTQHHV